MGKLTKAGGPEDKDLSASDVQITRKSIGSGQPPQGEWKNSGSGGIRNIEVKQNWLARLFRVKPATTHLCMAISRRRARQEIVILLREWKKYGIKGTQVDKQRNIIFSRVGSKNCKSNHYRYICSILTERYRPKPQRGIVCC